MPLTAGSASNNFDNCSRLYLTSRGGQNQFSGQCAFVAKNSKSVFCQWAFVAKYSKYGFWATPICSKVFYQLWFSRYYMQLHQTSPFHFEPTFLPEHLHCPRQIALAIQSKQQNFAWQVTSLVSAQTAAGNFYPVNETTKNAYLHNSGDTDGGQVEGIDGFQLHPYRECHTVGWVFHLPQHTA